MNHVVYREIASDEMLVILQLASKRKGVYQDLDVQVLGKPVAARRDGSTFQLRPDICDATHKNTCEGMLQCLFFARQSLHRHSAEGACPGCCSAALVGLPVRKLKAVGMPRCADCMIRGVLTQPPSKRARVSRE